MTTVTLNAVIKRINRKLRPDWKALRATRGQRSRSNLGVFYLLNTHRNAIENTHVDPEEYGRDLGVVGAWERVTAP
jgi:hypothetical protein